MGARYRCHLAPMHRKVLIRSKHVRYTICTAREHRNPLKTIIFNYGFGTPVLYKVRISLVSIK